MTWVRTDDAQPIHPKFFRAGVEAAGWWHGGLGYCNRNLTDGFIPVRDLDLVFPGTLHDRVLVLVGVLVREVLLHVVDPGKRIDCPSGSPHCRAFKARESGYLMHDYLDYQPSRREVLSKRRHLTSVRAEAGRQGGVKSGVSRRQRREAGTKQVAPVLVEANEAPSRPVPSRPKEEEPTTSPRGDAAAPRAAGRKKRDRQAGDTPHPASIEANREAVKAWVDLFTKYRGAPPVFDSKRDWPKFCAQVHPVVRDVGLDETRRLLERMFQSTHLKVTQSNYSLQFFAAEVNRWRGRSAASNGHGDTKLDRMRAAGEEAEARLLDMGATS